MKLSGWAYKNGLVGGGVGRCGAISMCKILSDQFISPNGAPVSKSLTLRCSLVQTDWLVRFQITHRYGTQMGARLPSFLVLNDQRMSKKAESLIESVNIPPE